jgi:tRNA pseudouridine13 synthase
MTPHPGALPDWVRAHGKPLFVAGIRSRPSDFVVDEQLGIEFSGDGEHDYLHVQKTAANTQWVARQLARHADVAVVDVGFGGLKDRHAETRQWFSVRRKSGASDPWSTLAIEGVRILEQRRHRRKLRRGAHKSNAFRIALRANTLVWQRDEIAERLRRIESFGVPNYFGEQRFGFDGGNLDLARRCFRGDRLSRDKRSIAISAARSFIFNEILAARVTETSWNRICQGDMANLDGSASIFTVTEVDDHLQQRCDEMDIHPIGSLWGSGAPLGSHEIAELERSVACRYPELLEGLQGVSIEASSRALRLPVRELRWDIDPDALWLEFRLPRGAYATAVLREIAGVEDMSKRRQAGQV